MVGLGCSVRDPQFFGFILLSIKILVMDRSNVAIRMPICLNSFAIDRLGN